ncbi:MAG: hypothetical protein RL557_1098, partial [archaeon]
MYRTYDIQVFKTSDVKSEWIKDFKKKSLSISVTQYLNEKGKKILLRYAG